MCSIEQGHWRCFRRASSCARIFLLTRNYFQDSCTKLGSLLQLPIFVHATHSLPAIPHFHSLINTSGAAASARAISTVCLLWRDHGVVGWPHPCIARCPATLRWRTFSCVVVQRIGGGVFIGVCINFVSALVTAFDKVDESTHKTRRRWYSNALFTALDRHGA